MIRFLNVYYPTRTVILLLCEFILVSGCFLGAAFYSVGTDDAFICLNYEFGFLKIAAVTVMSLMFSYYFDLYEPQIVSHRYEIYFRILLVLGFDCFIIAAVMFVYPEFSLCHNHEGNIYATGLFILTPALILWRRAYDWIVGHRFFREKVFVLGAGEYAKSIVDTIQQRPELGMEADWKGEDAPEAPGERKALWIETLKHLGDATFPVTRIIVAIESPRGEMPVEELLALRFRGIAVEDAGTLRERLSGKIQLDGLRPSNFLYSDGFRIRPAQQLGRQIVSTTAAAIGLLLFLPFFPFVVLAVRLSSKGPIFFRQTRVGVGGKPFHVYKFRSMFTDAEAGGARWATKNDPRVTQWGMIMRKTRIDEIPQLWNVLIGDMGFVGPRPERPEFIPMLTEALPFYSLRNLIRPGLTGWAQVRYGYGATLAETREKLEYDLYYVKHMSLGLDLLIMFETVKTILRRRGAQ